MSYEDKKVLVTGGLGFIGSNLVIRLAEGGARVTIVDSAVPGCGANPFNIQPVQDRVCVIEESVAELAAFADDLRGTDVVFNLAGEISHVHSVEFPERDLELNAVAQLQFLLALKKIAPGVRVVYAGTRQVYGVPRYLPVDEDHPVEPVDFNGVHKLAATTYHQLMSRSGEIDAVILRLTNVYGPRMALDVPCQGFLSTFFRRLLLGLPLVVFGDGNQLRDPVYVDDAVEAFLAAGLAPKGRGRVYNVGGAEAMRLADIAELASRAAGAPGVAYQPFPKARLAFDIGSYYTDWTRIRTELRWQPKVDFREGVTRTLDFYRRHLVHYLDPAHPEPACRMPEHNGTVRRLLFAEVTKPAPVP